MKEFEQFQEDLCRPIASVAFSAMSRAFAREDYAGALRVSMNALDEAPDQYQLSCQATRYDAWIMVGLCHLKLGEFSAARDVLSFLDDAMDTGPRSTRHLFLDAGVRMITYHADDIVQDLDRIVKAELDAKRFGCADILLVLGYAYLREKTYKDANRCFEFGFVLAQLNDEDWLAAEHANYLGLVRMQQGLYESSLEWFDRALVLSEHCGGPGRIGVNLLNRGLVKYKAGQFHESKSDLLLSLESLTPTTDQTNLTRTHIALGNVHRLIREFTDARQHLMTAYTKAAELAIPREECLALEFLGDVYRDEDRPEEALRYYQRAIAIGERIAPEGDLVMELLRRQGECLIVTGKPGKGLEKLAEGLTKARKLGDRFEEGVIMRCLAEGLLQTEHLDEAHDYAERAVELLDSIDARHEHAIARIAAAEVLLAISRNPGASDPRDRLDRAWDHGLVALGICRNLGIDHWNSVVKKLQSRIARRRAEEARYAHGGGALPTAAKAVSKSDIIIAESRAMKETLQAVDAFAPFDEPILLTGETGTGKEVLAKRIHRESSRADKSFIAVNITAIPDAMFEREFFGNVKGAFSGADADRLGLAAAADGGTLFLDEIGDLSLESQSKLLRLLQDGSYLCLGDPTERRADLRFIAATNCDLEKAVQLGKFREDLYYRIAGLTIPITALRDRPEDVLPMLDHFLSLSAGRQVEASDYFNETSLKLLQRYSWPGNVRELALVARRTFITQHTLGRVEVEVGVGTEAMVIRGRGSQAAVAMAGSLSKKDEPLSRARILLALDECDGNRTEAARRLGISRATLYRHLDRLDIS